MKKTAHGFTLVELLIVITIIAILSVVGITVYSGVQKSARDSARKADIQAISKALEVNKTATGYQLLNANQFASGAIPAADSQGHPYCISAPAAANPATWTSSCPASYNPVSNSQPAANSTSFNLCTATETTGNGGTPGVYCISNSQ